MTANAVPTTTVRVSARRAPITVSPTAAAAATSALKPTVDALDRQAQRLADLVVRQPAEVMEDDDLARGLIQK